MKKRSKLPKYVQALRSRHGKLVYYYCGVRGRRIRLANFGSPEFAASLELARAGTPAPVEMRQADVDRKRISQIEHVLTNAVRAARTRSRKRDWEFDLSAEWAIAQVRRQNYLCSLTGIPFLARHKATSKVHPYLPSFDRIDCKRGYTQDNVRIVVWAINAMMLDWGEDVFQSVARRYRGWLTKREQSMLPLNGGGSISEKIFNDINASEPRNM